MDILSNGYRKQMISAQHWSKLRGWCVCRRSHQWMHQLHLPVLRPSKVGWSPILGPSAIGRLAGREQGPNEKKCPVHTPSKHHPSTVVHLRVLVHFGPIWCCLKDVLHPRVHCTGHFIAAGGPDLLHGMLVYLKTRSSNPRINNI
jgi:hypothetical protein